MSSGARTLLPPGSFSNPQVLVCSRGCAKCLPPPHLPLLKPPKQLWPPLQQPQPILGLPPHHGRSEHSASFITRECSQSPYLGLCADTSPLPGREPGQGRPRGAPWARLGKKSSSPASREDPAFGMDTHVGSGSPGSPDPRWHPATCPLCCAPCQQPPARPGIARLAVAPQIVPA